MLVGSTRFPHYNQVVNLDDTIVAIATPPGRGGIGVVRLSGSKAIEIATPMLRLDHRLEPGRAFFRELVEPCGADTPVRLPGSETNPGTGGMDPSRHWLAPVNVGQECPTHMKSALTKSSSLILPSRILIRLMTSSRFRRMERRLCCNTSFSFASLLAPGWLSRANSRCGRFSTVASI